MNDDLNPQFVFNLTRTELLLKLAKGQINPQELAAAELAARGIGKGGKWIGYDRARKAWKL